MSYITSIIKTIRMQNDSLKIKKIITRCEHFIFCVMYNKLSYKKVHVKDIKEHYQLYCLRYQNAS